MNIKTNKPYHIFAEAVDQGALDQFESAMQQDFAVKGALMPDAHFGYSLPVGAVVATKDVIVPAWIGYDLGCGVGAIPTTFTKSDVIENSEKIFNSIYRSTPTGFNHNQKDSVWDHSSIPYTKELEQIFQKNGMKSLASLGGGNHFEEIGYDENDTIWVIIHSGSRNVGHATATHYMKIASGDGKAREGHFGFDVNSNDGKNYIIDLNFCLEFALENRRQLIQRTVREIAYYCNGEVDYSKLINRNHNHAELKDGLWIHRKGATHAEEGMMGVIPGNMRDGSFIVRGKGNPDALWSSSHGAGRVMSRKKAKETFTMEDFKDSMTGIKAKIDTATLDESPFAYKSIFEVMEQQSSMVETVAHILPILNIKG